MFVEAAHSPHRHSHQHDRKKQINADQEYPEPRLEAILKGLEDRVKAGRSNLFKLQYQKSELEFELRDLQNEKTVLDASLSAAKDGEELVNEKERQLNAELMKLSSSNDHADSSPLIKSSLIKRTLILGRELFSLLLRDIGIEDIARKVYEAQVTRIQEETAKKVSERSKLQEKVLMLQTDCEVNLEQKRQIYDEVHVLQKRRESLDAQILMLTEWRNSLENQITSVRAAIKQRRNTVSDSIVSSHSPSTDKPEDKSPPEAETRIVLYNQNVEEKPSHQICENSYDPLVGNFEPSKPAYELESYPCVSNDCLAFASGISSSAVTSSRTAASFESLEVNIDAPFTTKKYASSTSFMDIDTTQDSTGSESERLSTSEENLPSKNKPEKISTTKSASFNSITGDDEDETSQSNMETTTTDDSMLTMRTSRSVLFNLSASSTEDDDEDETTNTKAAAPFDNVLSQLRDAKKPF